MWYLIVSTLTIQCWSFLFLVNEDMTQTVSEEKLLWTTSSERSDHSSFFPLALQKRAPLFVLGMSACRYVTVLYASLPFMEELNPRMWNVPLPNLEFLLRGSRSEWTDRGSSAQTDWLTGALCGVHVQDSQAFSHVGDCFEMNNVEDQNKRKVAFSCSWL